MFLDTKSPTFFSYGLSVKYDMPDRESTIPGFLCTVEGRQPYRICFFGEKSSLADVLEPIAKDVGAEMVLCTGEFSTTRIFEVAERANDDGRPLVILYFSDFDPYGWQMSISVSRKIQACHDLLFPDLQAEVHHVALTLEHIEAFNLPETPLKAEDKRTDNWKAYWQHEQTEIDALLALHPETLRNITMDAIKPFYDDTLKRRSNQAWWECHQTCDALLEGHPQYASHKAEILKHYDDLAAASNALVEAQRQAYNDLSEIEPPQPVEPQPEITVGRSRTDFHN